MFRLYQRLTAVSSMEIAPFGLPRIMKYCSTLRLNKTWLGKLTHGMKLRTITFSPLKTEELLNILRCLLYVEGKSHLKCKVAMITPKLDPWCHCALVHVFHELYLRCGNKGSLGKSVVIFNQVFEEICTYRTLKK